jgi:hypothetical protein
LIPLNCLVEIEAGMIWQTVLAATASQNHHFEDFVTNKNPKSTTHVWIEERSSVQRCSLRQ